MIISKLQKVHRKVDDYWGKDQYALIIRWYPRSVGAKGGVYVSSESFDELKNVPKGATFEADDVVTSSGMSGTTSVVQSSATVITFMTNDDGSKVMPPVYLKAPVYIFRSADGKKHFKVEFTQYQNEDKVTGHVKFKFAGI